MENSYLETRAVVMAPIVPLPMDGMATRVLIRYMEAFWLPSCVYMFAFLDQLCGLGCQGLHEACEADREGRREGGIH